MSNQITQHFRQEKPHSSRQQAGKQRSGAAPGSEPDTRTTNPDIPPEEALLRAFDLDTAFGPCTGMTRLERWQRAERFGLNPPPAVRQLLDTLPGEHWNKNLWEGRL